MDYEMQIERYLLKGCCCAEAMVRAGLELLGEEDEKLCTASAGLCSGMHSGQTCGALTAGAMVLSLFAKSDAAKVMIPELVQWFDDTYGMEYGSMNCEDIAGPGQRFKSQRCRTLTMEVYRKCAELLIENGIMEE